jgi:hypothetical protein
MKQGVPALDKAVWTLHCKDDNAILCVFNCKYPIAGTLEQRSFRDMVESQIRQCFHDSKGESDSGSENAAVTTCHTFSALVLCGIPVKVPSHAIVDAVNDFIATTLSLSSRGALPHSAAANLLSRTSEGKITLRVPRRIAESKFESLKDGLVNHLESVR